MSNYDFLFKYILVGDTGVGKSSILLQFIDQKFKSSHDITIGVEFGSKMTQVDQKLIKLQIWDTAGQESFRSITRSYYRSAAGAILVYDITRRQTFEHVVKWLQEISQNGNQTATIILTGNKSDLEKNREVSYEEGKQLAEKNNIMFMEVSAKTAMNISNTFESSARNILQKIQNQTIDIQMDNSGIRIGGSSILNQVGQIQPNQQSQQKGNYYCCTQ